MLRRREDRGSVISLRGLRHLHAVLRILPIDVRLLHEIHLDTEANSTCRGGQHLRERHQAVAGGGGLEWLTPALAGPIARDIPSQALGTRLSPMSPRSRVRDTVGAATRF